MAYLGYAAIVAVSVFCFFFTIQRLPPPGPYYVCELDGDQSALYIKRVRTVSIWGNSGPGERFHLTFPVVEFKRISCCPGKTYSAAQSDWFKQVRNEDGSFYDTYKKLDEKTARELWQKHKKATSLSKTLEKIDPGIPQNIAPPYI